MNHRHTTAWLEALDAFVDGRRTLPFAWGSNDCCTFAADWVVQAAGVDPMADLRGLDGAATAGRALEREGGLLAAVTARMGQPLPGAFAQLGDVVLVRHAGQRPSMGVCVGQFVAAPGEAAMLLVPITQAEAAWRVG